MDALRRAGAGIEKGFPPGIDVAEQYVTYLQLLVPIALEGSPEEELKKIRASKPAGDDLTATTLKQALDAPQAKWVQANGRRFAARAAWGEFFKDHDAFMMPVDFIPAFPHDHSQDSDARVLHTPEGPRRYNDQLFWSSFAIMTGLPATVAPVGLTNKRLPVGVQILGPHAGDLISECRCGPV